ncbi:TPM domain-containing protein [Bacillus chungangensis]|uniref:TPM domain-containing protein n=1 Tax=Bacillus chungangensis TaxID=587633 RepID=A0ABT9WW63_9BACI|nr:TPM domain-containing protein [Bacillus chungangensis]MDQ0177470.1 uncharacterized protein [Bacillus chungangensis]
MRKSLLLFPLLFLLAVSFIAGKADAVEIPKPGVEIYVQDYAQVLSENEKQELIQLGHQLHRHTKAQIAVLTIPSLEGEDIRNYAVQAFRTYELGDKDMNNGVLILLAKEDRKIQVEVGYGLEGALPDGKVGRILDDYALPYLKEGNIGAAIANTYKKLFNEVAEEYQWKQVTDAESYYTEGEGLSALEVILIVSIIIVFIILDMKLFKGALTHTLLQLLAFFISRGGGGGSGDGGSRGGGGSSGGGGAGRSW